MFKYIKSDNYKRYSDPIEPSKRRYWYFTLHGIGPGTIPSDLHVLETRDGQNEKGTWGTFVCLDGVLNTSELKKYDLKELSPDDGPTFTARSYYDRNFSGLEDSVENVSLSEAEDFCHEHLMNGGYVELEGDISSVRIDPDDYAENFDGEFYCTPELNKWHKRVFGF